MVQPAIYNQSALYRCTPLQQQQQQQQPLKRRPLCCGDAAAVYFIVRNLQLSVGIYGHAARDSRATIQWIVAFEEEYSSSRKRIYLHRTTTNYTANTAVQQIESLVLGINRNMKKHFVESYSTTLCSSKSLRYTLVRSQSEQAEEHCLQSKLGGAARRSVALPGLDSLSVGSCSEQALPTLLPSALQANYRRAVGQQAAVAEVPIRSKMRPVRTVFERAH